MMKIRLTALALILLILAGGYAIYATNSPDRPFGYKPFLLGLDLQGGTQLTYEADITEVPSSEVEERMQSLKEVVARRATSGEVAGALGVTDPIIQTETVGFGDDSTHRLIVELPGVTDIEAAIDMIGETPVLEFRLANVDAPAYFDNLSATATQAFFTATGLTGRNVTGAQVQFLQGQGHVGSSPLVVVDFDKEGNELFAQLTRENIGQRIGIFLDGYLISSPVVREEISGGTAQISGNFTLEEAQSLTRDLNFGALPMPIELIGTQSVGPSLGMGVIDSDMYAGVAGLLLLALFMVAWYRVPGFVGSVALLGYIVTMLALFKFLGVTITAPGIAGLILSIGMAVDANIVIFERIKEEMKVHQKLSDAIRAGFSRAWPPIRDANITSMLTAIVLFYAFGQTFVRGFAVTLFLGVLVSMFSAVVVSRVFLLAITDGNINDRKRTLFGSGFPKKKA